MLRKLLTAVCTGEVLAPDAPSNTAERIALDNPDECEFESLVAPGARLEGLLFLGLMWRSDASYYSFKKFLEIIGLLALLYPSTYVAYEDLSHPQLVSKS